MPSLVGFLPIGLPFSSKYSFVFSAFSLSYKDFAHFSTYKF